MVDTGPDGGVDDGADPGSADDPAPSWPRTLATLGTFGAAAVAVALGPLPLAGIPRWTLAAFLAARGVAPLPFRLRPAPGTWALATLLRGSAWIPLAVALAALLPWTAPTSGLTAGLAVAGFTLRRARQAVALDVAGPGVLVSWTGAIALAAAALLAGLGVGTPVPAAARGVVAAAALAALATFLARDAQGADEPPLPRLTHALAGSLPRNVLAASGLAAFLLARPTLARRLRYLPLFEWSLGVILASLALERTAEWYRTDAPEAPWTSLYRRHVQQVQRLGADPVHDLHRAARAWLDGEASPEAYARAWAPVLERLDAPALEAAIQDLRTHEDRDPPRLLRLPSRVEAVREANRRTRADLHQRLVDALDEGGASP